MNGVIYARYSSDNQREESIEGQLRECKAYAEHNNITIIGTYIDRAMSAKTDNRPDFQKMIKDSEKGQFDIVIVWKLDRFSRDRYDSAYYKHRLKKNSVRVLSATENIAEGPEGVLLESILEGMAEYYSKELAIKVKRGLTENALKCKYNGGTVTYGYYIDDNQNFQIDPDAATVVVEIFTRYAEGSTMKEIVDYLNNKGIKAVRVKTSSTKPIGLNFVSNLLHNRRYIGEYSYDDIIIADGIPAIVSQELFDRVQERMANNKKAPAKHKAEDDYLLTTKLFCGTCKAFMVGESGTSRNKQVYHYYRCVNTKKKKNCTAKRKTIKKTAIENAVVNAVMEKLMDDAFLEYLADMAFELQGKESSELPLMRKQLLDCESGINNVVNAIQSGVLNDALKQRLNELEVTKKELEASIAIEEIKKPSLTREQILYWLYRFRKLNVTQREARQKLIDSFVNAIVVYDDCILISFNYKDGTKQISFKDIECSDLSFLAAP